MEVIPATEEDTGIFGLSRDKAAESPTCGESSGACTPTADEGFFLTLANTRMPFGKYAGRYLVDLPEPYVVWFRKQGWPEGQLGSLLAALYEIKVNGLEELIRPFIHERSR